MKAQSKWCDYLGQMLLLLLIMLVIATVAATAESEGRVQSLSGQIELGEVVAYDLPRLTKGSTLYISAKATSGDFDPLVAITDTNLKAEDLSSIISDRLQQAVTSAENPQQVYSELASKYFLAWNDDHELHDAHLEYTVPNDGDYRLFLVSAISNNDLVDFEPILTMGEYRLVIGVDFSGVLASSAVAKGESIAFRRRPDSDTARAIQKVSGEIMKPDQTSAFYFLENFHAGDTLYVYVTVASGDLVPSVRLNDYASKPLVIADAKSDERNVVFSYQFDQSSESSSLHISGETRDHKSTYGEFDLLIGVNAPEVLSGKANSSGPLVIKEPTKVQIGIRIQQVTDVNQESETIGIVGSLEMRWLDTKLSFNPDRCKCAFRSFSLSEFANYLEEKDTIWPDFTFYNQQGNRWSQNKLVTVFSSGEAIYFERFSATFQAPDFNFRNYPFDTQTFYIRVDSIFPEEFFVFDELPGYTKLGKVLGEEQWKPINFESNFSTVYSSTFWPTSQFSVRITATRHTDYYIFRIFLPIFFILVVSWITFFSTDYDKRVDVASGNLLLFVAFNFIVAQDLPRLGYLTFMDTVLVASFVMTSFGVIYNVILKRVEARGKRSWAQKIDRFLIWLYPLIFAIVVGLLTQLFG